MEASAVKERIIAELETMDEHQLEHVLRIVAAEKRLSDDTALLSEDTLARIWDTPEEDEAWRDL